MQQDSIRPARRQSVPRTPPSRRAANRLRPAHLPTADKPATATTTTPACAARTRVIGRQVITQRTMLLSLHLANTRLGPAVGSARHGLRRIAPGRRGPLRWAPGGGGRGWTLGALIAIV